METGVGVKQPLQLPTGFFFVHPIHIHKSTETPLCITQDSPTAAQTEHRHHEGELTGLLD